MHLPSLVVLVAAFVALVVAASQSLLDAIEPNDHDDDGNDRRFLTMAHAKIEHINSDDPGYDGDDEMRRFLTEALAKVQKINPNDPAYDGDDEERFLAIGAINSDTPTVKEVTTE
ncbi:Aste57867_14076 [Aphanomyces stellatus]|uniref:Aste57867_14076 protein n=1 Tax=Aphanomyces stellatus TaxID=120398 RepID=A0A485L0F1_9STRA|nr:hypothetical protein As57867_014025 [Aphanomyces stellatus]VFT90904.1 Aste57867_14076 [Aphanomyces stellatus]